MTLRRSARRPRSCGAPRLAPQSCWCGKHAHVWLCSTLTASPRLNTRLAAQSLDTVGISLKALLAFGAPTQPDRQSRAQ